MHSALSVVGTRGWIARHKELCQWLAALPWLLPTLLGLLIFTQGATFASLFISFTHWEILILPRWIGLGNYIEAYHLPLFWRTLKNTLYYTALSVPLNVTIAGLLALAMNQKLRGITLFRTLYFLPVVTSTVAVAVVWYWIYNSEFGLLNYVLSLMGITGPPWLASTRWAMPAVIIMSIWKGVGVNMMIFLAGLQDVPKELYEAAEIDGAGSLQRFWHVTVPMVSPTTFFVLVLAVIGSFQVFEQTYVLTQGGPGYATLTLALYIYQQAFQSAHMGFAAALAYVLFAFMLAATLAQFKLQARWVHYG